MSHGAIGSLDRSLSALQWLKNYGGSTTDGNMNLNQNFQEFIKSFVAHDVRYLIVDGYAMAAH